MGEINFPELNPRHKLRNMAYIDASKALLRVIERHDLSFGEIFVILSELMKHWAYILRKGEDVEGIHNEEV